MMKKIKISILLIIALSLISNVIYAQGIGTEGKDGEDIFYEINIGGPAANLGVSFDIKTPIKVNGGTGTFKVIPIGGTPPYRIFIKRGTTIEQQINNVTTTTEIESKELLPGKYLVEIRDANYVNTSSTCNTITSAEIELINPPLLRIRGEISQEIQCNGGQGKIRAYIRGGAGPESYTVQLLKGSSIEETKSLSYSGSVERPIEFTGVSVGNYTIKVKDKYNIEKETGIIKLEQPITFNVTSVNIKKNVSCNIGNTGNKSDGQIEIKTVGGTAPYKATINGAGITRNIESSSNTINISGLKAGSYSITVEDAFKCVRVFSFNRTINPPSKIEITPNVTSKTSPTNIDGQVEFEITGGVQTTTGYTYEFNGRRYTNADSNVSITNNGGKYIVNFTKLDVGDYVFKVTDKNSCSESVTIKINNPKELKIDNTIPTHVNCYGEKTGQINVIASGGFQTPYRYQLFRRNSSVVLKTLRTPIFTGLEAGDYTVKVAVIINEGGVDRVAEIKEANVRINTASEITINPPVIKNAICKGDNGEVTLAPSGGTGTLTYQWRKTGSSSIVSTKRDLEAKAGIYNVTIIDANTCSKIFQNIEIKEPSNELTVITSEVDLTINTLDLGGINPDGKITVTATEGWGGYTYQWKEGSNNLTETSNVLENVRAGIYSVTVTDREGCSKTLPNLEIKEPEQINTTISYPNETDKISCNGANNATIQVSFNSNGPIIESFQWYKTTRTNFISGTKDKNIIDDKEPGKYGVEAIVKNNRNESVKIYPANDFEVIEPEKLEVDIVKTKPNNSTCFGETGSLSLFVKGGTGDYTYRLRRNGGTLETPVVFSGNVTIPNLEAVNYSVEIRDANNCSLEKEYEFKIEAPTEIVVTKVEDKDATVFGKSDGIIIVKVAGGLPFNPTATAHYNYVLTESGSTISVKNGSTTTNSSGEQVVELRDIAGSVAGKNYVLTITDASTGGCAKTTLHTIKEPEVLTVSLQLDKHVNCFGGNDGQLSLGNITGGKTTNYRYEWFKKEAGAFISLGATKPLAIEAGEYKVRVAVIFEGKETESKETNIIDILQPTPLKVVEIIQKVRCFNGTDGEIKLNVTGGVIGGGNAIYTYNWSNGATTKEISNLSAGSYTVTITYNGSCSFKETYQIEEPINELVGNLDTCKDPTRNILDLNGTIPDGNITATITGGRTPYVYKWTDALGNVVGNNTNKLENVGGGIYTLEVTDDNGVGCVKTFTRELKEPAQFLVSINPLLVEELKCFGDINGSIEATVEGGLKDYTYKWYEKLADGTKQYISAPKGTVQKLEAIGAGTYGVEVTDNGGIGVTKSAEFELVQNKKLELTYNVKPVSCYKGEDGEIDITVTGGTGVGTYTYNWERGDKTEDLKGLVAGKYSIRVLDRNNCIVEEKDIEVTQPEEHIVTAIDFITPTGAGKEDGKISVSISGNTTDPYTLEWLDGGGDIIGTTETIDKLKADNYTLKILVDGKCTFEHDFPLTEPKKIEITIKEIGEIKCYGDLAGRLELETTGGVGGNKYKWFNVTTNSEVRGNLEKVFNLPAGEYYVTVKDRNGIEARSENYTITQPPLLEVTSSSENVSCFDHKNGFITLEAQGGTGKYFYSISKDKAAYETEVEFTNSTMISNLDIGTYDIKIRDENGCDLKEAGVNKILSFTITQPEKLEVSEVVTNATGFGLENGNIITTITGGTEPYLYSWKNTSGTEIETTKDITNYGAGIYTLQVTDAQKCVLSKEITIDQPDLLEVTIQQQNIVLCKGDETASIISEIKGGIQPYKTYEWFKKGETDVKSIIPRLNNIGVGIYYLVVTDAENNRTQSADISIEEPDFLTVNLVSKSEGCGTNNDWAIEANVSGGTAPFKYFWSTGATTKEITNQSLGTYFVVITDANGCQITERITLENTNIFNVEVTTKELTCFNACSGEIELDITGGQAPYTIHWNSGATTTAIKNLCAGQYIVEVEDSNGCREVKTIEIKNPEEFIFELIPDKVTLCQDENIEYDVTMNNVSEYRWTSTNGFTSDKSKVTLETAGNYTLTIVTTEGCTVSRNLEIIKSETIIDAQLILTSQAFAGEDIAIINVSVPISSNVDWQVPPNVEIVQKEKEGIIVKFPAPGDYEISLVSLEGDCSKKQTKVVTVLKSRNLADAGDSEDPFIKKYEAYANPNKGQFKVDVILEKEAEISLRLFGLGASTVTLDKRFKGEKEYTIDYDMNVPAGIYVLLLETSKAKRILKIIIE